MITQQIGSVAELRRDEMELKLMLSPIAELLMMAMHSLAFTRNQTDLRDVFRSFMDAFQPQGEHEVLELLTLRDRVSPTTERVGATHGASTGAAAWLAVPPPAVTV